MTVRARGSGQSGTPGASSVSTSEALFSLFTVATARDISGALAGDEGVGSESSNSKASIEFIGTMLLLSLLVSEATCSLASGGFASRKSIKLVEFAASFSFSLEAAAATTFCHDHTNTITFLKLNV